MTFFRRSACCVGIVLCGCERGTPEAPQGGPTTSLAVEAPEPQTPSAVAAQTQTVPSEYCTLPSTPPAATGALSEFADYAWRLFTAVNWPAKVGSRGEPDCTLPFAQDSARVWETYKTTEQLFLPNAQDPGPWASGSTHKKQLHFRSKVDAAHKLPPSIQQAVGGWLVDQAGKPTYYEIAVDQASYDYVVENQYYDANVLNTAKTIDFPQGALEVKGAWRIISPEQSARYHAVSAEVMGFDDQGKPTGKYEPATVGLVGFHVVYKPAGFPQWIWTTFEQVDNLAGAHPSYSNPDCQGAYCTPNMSPTTSGQPFTVPNQIERVTPITDTVATINDKWQALLRDTPFRYYQLVSPQWPADPNDPGNPQGTPTPGTVANVTMESYIQPTSSCMDCHSTARVPNDSIKTNYSFIFLSAQSSAP